MYGTVSTCTVSGEALSLCLSGEQESSESDSLQKVHHKACGLHISSIAVVLLGGYACILTVHTTDEQFV